MVNLFVFFFFVFRQDGGVGGFVLKLELRMIPCLICAEFLHFYTLIVLSLFMVRWILIDVLFSLVNFSNFPLIVSFLFRDNICDLESWRRFVLEAEV